MTPVDYHKRFAELGFQSLGPAAPHAESIHALIKSMPLLEEFSMSEIARLGAYMQMFEAPAGGVIIAEGDLGDFMVVVLSGSVDVAKKDKWGKQSRIAVTQAGAALGEMSMLDGEPRFASCIALEPTRFAVLSRTSLTEVIRDEAHLGAKILLKLVHMLSQRLRVTSGKLVNYLESAT
jgi:CRP/FNR family cyclic AMP-dependent transcriptional regulator